MLHLLTKGTKALLWIRLWAGIVLIFTCCWIYFDLEIYLSAMARIPLFYYLPPPQLYLTNKLTSLLLPIIVNIALWIPQYRSYFFLRVVFYAEQIKIAYLLVTFALVLPAQIRKVNSYQGSDNVAVVALSLLFLALIVNLAINTKIMSSLKKEENKQFFHVEDRFEKASKWSIASMAVLLVFSVFALTVTEYYGQLQYMPKYTNLETREIYYEVLRHKGELISNNRFHYVNEVKQDVGFRTELSPDAKMLLLRINLKYDEGQNLYIFDTTSLEHTKILQTPIVRNVQRTDKGYSFSKDNKYIIVGDPPSAASHQKFQALDIATGKRDDRFSDPKGMLKSARELNSKVKVIRFSPTGKYFLIMFDRDIEVWDYELGQPVYTKAFDQEVLYYKWFTDGKFLISNKTSGYMFDIHNDGSVESNSIGFYSEPYRDIKNNTNPQNRYQATVNTMHWYIFRLDRINIWDTYSGKKITSIYCRGGVQNIQLHPDGKRLLVFERLRSRSGRITAWDMSTGEKLQELFVKPIEWSGSMKIIDNGRKILFIGKKIHILSLE